MHQKTITCLNGQFVSAEEARVSITDRGFRYGDGLFETIRVDGGVPYQWELHLSRLNTGLAALRIAPPVVDFQVVARALITKNALREGFVRIVVSRGVGGRGYLPDAQMTATWAMECLPATPLPEAPLKLHLSNITRPPLSSLPGNSKLAHGIGSTLALMEARDHGCDEALMLTMDGKICEAAAANLFWVANGKIFTPALSTGCLAGTTRAAVMRLVEVQETLANIGTLHNADALFVTNTRLGVWPAINAKFKLLESARHPIVIDLMKRLAADIAAGIAANKAQWA